MMNERSRAAGLEFEKALLPPVEASVNVTNLADFQRLERQLGTVREKIMLTEEFMRNTPDYTQSDVLEELINFLEACRSRLPEIAEAGSMGMLCADLLSEVLSVQDSVNKTVTAYRKGGIDTAESTKEVTMRSDMTGGSGEFCGDNGVIRGRWMGMDDYDDEGL